jgi:hypothetical protein
VTPATQPPRLHASRTAALREIGRLAIMQRYPAHYIQRRVELLDLPDDYHYGVTVKQQFEVPFHGDSKESPQDVTLLVPLGQFSKDRMPDLEVLGPDGSILPLLTRHEHGDVGVSLFAARWQKFLLSRAPGHTRDEALLVWAYIASATKDIVTAPKSDALRVLYRLKGFIVEGITSPEYSRGMQRRLLRLKNEDAFWTSLRALAESRLLIAKLKGMPGSTYVVSVKYTERFLYRGYAGNNFWGVVRKGLAWLGLIGIPISRSVANLGQAASLWVVQSVPEGTEPLRYYWKSERHTPETRDGPVSVELTRAVESRHLESGEKSEKDDLLLDVQISPSTAIMATIGLAALLLVVATYVYQALPDLINNPEDPDRAVLVGLGSIFAAVPAGIAGALAYRGQTFVRRASRGPRFLLAGLSAQAAFFAAVVSLKNLGHLAEGVAYVLSVYSLIVIGVFAYIQFGPRWRKNETSRRKSATEQASPTKCRQRQVQYALMWVLFWAIAVIVFARCQAVLQETHFFTSEFPGNIWRAWWSWFCL